MDPLSRAPVLGLNRRYPPTADQYERVEMQRPMEEAERFDWLVAMNAGEGTGNRQRAAAGKNP